ncbi:MAG: hypothetical protein DRO18_04350, partial [Thermoprotei archaeon]
MQGYNQYLGKIEVGLGEVKYVPVHWDVNVTSLNQKSPYYQLNITANTTDEIPPINFYQDMNYTTVKVYEYESLGCPAYATNGTDVTQLLCSLDTSLGQSYDNTTFEAALEPGGKLWIEFNCTPGDTRLTHIVFRWEADGTTTVMADVWNGSKWRNWYDEFVVGENVTESELQIISNELGLTDESKCVVYITNTGNSTLYLDYIFDERYFVRKVKISDIEWHTKDGNVFNISVVIANPFNYVYKGNLTLNLTDGSQVYYSNTTNLTFGKGIARVWFYNINLSSLSYNHYKWIAKLKLNTTESDSRWELFEYARPHLYIYAPPRMCPNSTDYVIVDYQRTLEDVADINISVNVPSGWSVSPPYYYFHRAREKELHVKFNITSPSTSENATVNVTIFTSYEDTELNFTTRKSFVVKNGIQPVIEIKRETPAWVAPDKVFESALIIHNKGCAPTTEPITLKEKISSGWTPANPTLSSNLQLIGSQVDLENNEITWQIGYISPGEYGVARYQVKSPTSLSTPGSFEWELSYEDLDVKEYKPHEISTANYTQESHLEYDLIVYQLPEFPWEEPRSFQPNYAYNFSLVVRNIGDVNATNWTVYLDIPDFCEIKYATGDVQGNLIIWNLTELGSRERELLNFSLNCTKLGRFELKPYAIRDTRGSAFYQENLLLSCAGIECSQTYIHTFQHPSMPYEYISWFGIYHEHNFTGYNLSIGEMKIEISKDNNEWEVVHEYYTFEPKEEAIWANYTISEETGKYFVNPTRKIRIYGHADATYRPFANVSVTKLAYRWSYGKLFNESTGLFVKSKIYTYVPLLENATLWINGNSSKDAGGWGESFVFGVKTRDRFGRNVTVYAWHRVVGGSWQFMGKKTCENCLNWTQLNFTYDYQPTDIETWEFKFNASNEDGDNEIYGKIYKVEKDDVKIDLIKPENEQIVNRSSTTVFAVRLFDLDNQSYPTGTTGKVYISIFDISTYETTPPILSSSDGWLNRTIENEDWCSDKTKYYLGKHSWYAVTSGDPYIKDNSSYKWNFTLKGELTNTIISPIGVNFSYELDNTITIKGSVVDDCGDTVTDATVYFNLTNGNYVYKCIATIVGNEYHCDFKPQEVDAPLGWYNITMHSNKTLHWDGLAIVKNAFYLASVPDVNASVSPQTGAWGQSPFNFTSYITDEDNDTVYIKFYIKKGAGAWNLEYEDSCDHCMNYKAFYQRNFTCNATQSDVGIWYFRVNVSDV